jgi:uncharacterized protein YegP (UPF0339 family)
LRQLRANFEREKPMKFEYWKSKNEWRFHLLAASGRILCHSEGYKRKRDCLRAIGLVQLSGEAKVREKD